MTAPTVASRTIVFSHANGFPAGTYRVLFEAWRAAGYTVVAIEKYGHDPQFPVTDRWPHLRDQLIRFIEAEAGGAAILVGHSLGGYLSLMAASRRPDLATGVVMLDSPVLSGWKASAVRFAKACGLARRFSPSVVSRRRRQQWSDADAAFAHFAAKAAFARWEPAVLRDYIATGTETHENARRLAFDRDVESAIYDSIPHHLGQTLRRHPLRCPMAFVRGTDSEEIRRAGMSATTRLAEGRVSRIEGSHLFPFERPAETAAEVLKLIATMGVEGKTARL